METVTLASNQQSIAPIRYGSDVMTKEEQLLDKQKEIANYERILAAYKGRWWDMGKRHLDQLKDELIRIQDSLQ